MASVVRPERSVVNYLPPPADRQGREEHVVEPRPRKAPPAGAQELNYAAVTQRVVLAKNSIEMTPVLRAKPSVTMASRERGLVLSEGLRPSDSPARALA